MVKKYLNNRFFILYFIPFILGSLTVFSFQPFNLTLINFLILPLFFYLIVHIKKKSKSTYRNKPYRKNLFMFGSAFGFGYYLGGIHWITHSLTFDENFKILIPFGLILIPLFLSLFFSIVTLLVGPLLNLNIASIFFLSGSLAFSDYLRAKILTGFPWNLWAYSFSWATEIIQILNNIGLYAFNLMSITIFMTPAILFFNIKLSKKFLLLIILALVLFILYIYGNHSINKNKFFLKSNINKFNIKVVSPNFNLEYELAPKEIENRLKKLIRYSEPNQDLKTLFVWPEGVFNRYSFKEVFEFKDIISNNFNKNHYILFGVNKFDEAQNGFYNSLVIINDQFELIQEYKKQKLVPFGEFLPFERILNNFGLKKITEGHGAFLKGGEQNNLIIGQLNILPLICYEVIFTKFIQQSNPETNVIINISEDGWFGNTIGPHQHFAKGIFRAIEKNSFLIRSANKGISAIINNKGETVKKLNSVEVGNIELEVPLIKTNNKNKNDLIFFILLFTYILFFKYYKKKNVKK
jgi:apolipoprotein N-acyltransferase